MNFENRLWKIDIENLWWNEDRIKIRNSLINHFRSGGGPAHLTGIKGHGKSTLAAYLAKKLGATTFRMVDSEEDHMHEFNCGMLIIDEAQKLSQEERKEIMNKNRTVLMVSVIDLSEDGYKLVHEIKPLTNLEIKSYINYQKSLDYFTPGAIDEVYKASKGGLRLINLICREALNREDILINRNIIAEVAKKRFKLRY